MLYELFKKFVGFFFNLLNFLMKGNLPPFGCVCVVIEEPQGYLVVEAPEGGLVFPGGFMRWHEHVTQTARREVKEETGLHIRVGDVISYYSLASSRLDRMSTLNIIYKGEVVGGELRASIEGRPLWLSEEEIRGRLKPLYLSILEDYLQYRNGERRPHMNQP